MSPYLLKSHFVLRVNVYDVVLGGTKPTLRVIGTLVIDIDAPWFALQQRDMYCCNLHLTDGATVVEIRNFHHPVVWDFTAGWYALGPERNIESYHQRVRFQVPLHVDISLTYLSSDR